MLTSMNSTVPAYKDNIIYSTIDFHQATKKRILLIDDDEDLGNLLKGYVSRKFNCRVTLATDSFEAMNVLTEEFYDLIFLDWKLPALTGGQTLQLLEQGLYYEPELPIQWDSNKVPVVIFSAYDRNQCILKSRSTKHFNVIGHVSKKQSLQSIVDCLGLYIDGLFRKLA